MPAILGADSRIDERCDGTVREPDRAQAETPARKGFDRQARDRAGPPGRRRRTETPAVEPGPILVLPDADPNLVFSCRPDGPIRLPCWRWILGAAWARSRRRKPPRGCKRDDAALRRVRDLARAVLRGGDPRLADPDLAAAYEFSLRPADERAPVEAFLIAGLTDAEVAEKTCLPVEVVGLYADVFYALRGGGVSYVAHAAGVSWLCPEDPAERHAWQLRVAAFVFGAEAVELLLCLGGPADIGGPAGPGPSAEEAVHSKYAAILKLKAYLALVAMELRTPRDFRRMIRLDLRLRRSELRERRFESARRDCGGEGEDLASWRCPSFLDPPGGDGDRTGFDDVPKVDGVKD